MRFDASRTLSFVMTRRIGSVAESEANSLLLQLLLRYNSVAGCIQ